MKKITLATVKSFIKKNPELFIRVNSKFDGMVDCVMSNPDAAFNPALPAQYPCDNNQGIQGAWFVKSSRDWFQAFETDTFKGYEVSNCCGSFALAIKKEAA
jgi:hypothetical protein